jgi:hypothetical protein
MKHQLTPVAAALFAAVLVCGGAGAATAAQTASAAPLTLSGEKDEKKCPPENDEKDEERDDEEREQPGIGDSLNLDDLEDQVRMTVVDVVDPATPEDEFSAPAAGNRLVSVQFCVENTGDGFFEDFLLDTQIIDEDGQRFDTLYLYSDAGPHFPDVIRVSPHEAALGFITYEIPKGSELDKVSYLMPLGFGGGDDQGEWDISEGEQREELREDDAPAELDLAPA